MEIEIDSKSEMKKDRVKKSLEIKMKYYQFLERRVYLSYMIIFTLSLSLLVFGFSHPIYNIIYTNYDSVYNVENYFGYFSIFSSIMLYAFLQQFLSRDKRIELKILNNSISSMYDDYLMGDISLWELKAGVESMIEYYLKNSKNIFILYGRY